MTQEISNLNISPWQFVGVVVLAQVLANCCRAENAIGTRLGYLIDDLSTGVKKTIYDFPVIALTGGFTYIIHQYIPSSASHLSLSTLGGAEGSLKVATFVSGVFALKAALSSYFETHVTRKQVRNIPDGALIDQAKNQSDLIRDGIIYNLFPLAMASVGAYYASIPLKLVQCALYTASLIGVVKLLGKGYEHFLANEKVSVIFQEWYSWLNLESPLSPINKPATPKK